MCAKFYIFARHSNCIAKIKIAQLNYLDIAKQSQNINKLCACDLVQEITYTSGVIHAWCALLRQYKHCMMDWSFCVICGDGGDLKCPANSNQDNGLEVYGRFLETVAEFRHLESLPVSIKFIINAETFLRNEAKWHKTCHLKFAPSKLLRLQKRKQSLEPGSTATEEIKATADI